MPTTSAMVAWLASNWLGLYGAILSTAVAGWAIYTWLVATWTRVEIRLVVDYLHPFTGDAPKVGVYITILNLSHHRIRVLGLGSESPDGRSSAWLMPQALPAEAQTPAEIQPHDSFTTWLPRTYLETSFFNGSGRTRYRAQLSNGRIAKTKILRPKDVPGYRSYPDELPAMLSSARDMAETPEQDTEP